MKQKKLKQTPKETPNKFDIQEFDILYDNVLIKAIEIGEANGVIRPNQYDDKPELGEVMKVGEGRIFENGTIIPLKVKIGDVVYFNKYSTTKFKSGREDWYICREEDLVGYKRK